MYLTSPITQPDYHIEGDPNLS